jgi:uncharacterized protein
MNYLYILLILAILGLLYMRLEASMLEVKTVKFTKSKDCLKVMQLSDIHIYYLRVNPNKIKTAILKEKPDLILITGDYVNKPSHIPAFLKFLNKLDCNINTYLCLGNHDFKAFIQNSKTEEIDINSLDSFIKAIQKTGATVLQNQCICIQKNSKKYNIIGISDMRYNMHNLDKAFDSACPDAFMNIAFSHNPDIALQIPQGKADYLLCGHFHGGQIWAPFNIEFKLMRKEQLCKMGIRRGLHKLNGMNIYLNRGIGNVCFPLRFLSKPEITVFYLP